MNQDPFNRASREERMKPQTHSSFLSTSSLPEEKRLYCMAEWNWVPNPNRRGAACSCWKLLINRTGRGVSHCTLCDGRPNSPALEPRAPVSVPPEPPVPPVPIVPPEVPWLDPPLMPDALRRVELQQRLSVYFIGRHDAAHLPQFLGTLEKQVLLERRIEAALVQDGYNPHRIIMQRHEIRGILFNHPTRAVALSERTLDAYINQIERNGTRQSIPYRRVELSNVASKSAGIEWSSQTASKKQRDNARW
ncbi:hypothetical protein QYF36_022740 [Acer negundo]|nr:hypothetical protein QYF36_022740 [Acer negundo]